MKKISDGRLFFCHSRIFCMCHNRSTSFHWLKASGPARMQGTPSFLSSPPIIFQIGHRHSSFFSSAEYELKASGFICLYCFAIMIRLILLQLYLFCTLKNAQVIANDNLRGGGRSFERRRLRELELLEGTRIIANVHGKGGKKRVEARLEIVGRGSTHVVSLQIRAKSSPPQ